MGPDGEAVTDSFYFVHQPLTGNGSITVRVTSLTGLLPTANGQPPLNPNASPDIRPGLEPWAKAGIIVKASTRQGSAYAAMMVTGATGCGCSTTTPTTSPACRAPSPRRPRAGCG